MLKSILLGLCALSLGLLANTSFAGNLGACDEERASNPDWPSGLYGLCVAYHNAEPGRAQDRIEELYAEKARKAGYDDLVIPGTAPEIPDVQGICPCWDDAQLAHAVAEDFSPRSKYCGTVENADISTFDYFDVGEDQHYLFEAGEYMDGVFYCRSAAPEGGGDLQFAEPYGVVTQADIYDCVTQIAVAWDELGDDCVW